MSCMHCTQAAFRIYHNACRTTMMFTSSWAKHHIDRCRLHGTVVTIESYTALEVPIVNKCVTLVSLGFTYLRSDFSRFWGALRDHACSGRILFWKWRIRSPRSQETIKFASCMCVPAPATAVGAVLVGSIGDQRGMVFTHGVWMSDRNCCLAYFADSEKTHRIHTYTVYNHLI